MSQAQPLQHPLPLQQPRDAGATGTQRRALHSAAQRWAAPATIRNEWAQAVGRMKGASASRAISDDCLQPKSASRCTSDLSAIV